MATENAIEIGEITETVFMRDLRNVQVGITPIDQHAPGPEQSFGEDERGKRRPLFFEQFPHITTGLAATSVVSA